MQGKLPEEMAVEWEKVKNMPKVVCPLCGEHFTRGDALSRHHTKQHTSKKKKDGDEDEDEDEDGGAEDGAEEGVKKEEK
jgi:hypothetical protein